MLNEFLLTNKKFYKQFELMYVCCLPCHTPHYNTMKDLVFEILEETGTYPNYIFKKLYNDVIINWNGYVSYFIREFKFKRNYNEGNYCSFILSTLNPNWKLKF
jgi:hypothetical protein